MTNPSQRTGPFVIERGCRFEVRPEATLHVGRGVVIRRHALVQVDGRLTIGSGTFFNRSAHICCFEEIRIGSACRFGEFVSIHDENHLVTSSVRLDANQFVTAPITIGDRVWVGAKASILPGVTIGDDAVIAAHAVVNRDVPAGALVGGVPARVLRA